MQEGRDTPETISVLCSGWCLSAWGQSKGTDNREQRLYQGCLCSSWLRRQPGGNGDTPISVLCSLFRLVSVCLRLEEGKRLFQGYHCSLPVVVTRGTEIPLKLSLFSVLCSGWCLSAEARTTGGRHGEYPKLYTTPRFEESGAEIQH
jgi:hypothetical protein